MRGFFLIIRVAVSVTPEFYQIKYRGVSCERSIFQGKRK